MEENLKVQETAIVIYTSLTAKFSIAVKELVLEAYF